MGFIYRALPKTKSASGKLIIPHRTKRPPENVPYIVDSLWEWVRPQNYPNLKYAIFVSLDPELTFYEGGECNVYRVEFQAGSSKYKKFIFDF